MDDEREIDSEAFGAPGIVFRPREPETIRTPNGEFYAEVGAEAMVARRGRLTPLAWRDLRLNLRFPAPKPGSVAMVGYGGGFVSLDDYVPPSQDPGLRPYEILQATRFTIYVPALTAQQSTPAKAHAIIVDPETSAISVIHADGMAIVLTDEGITLRAGDSTWIKMEDGAITIAASKIVLAGNVALGASPATAVPIAPTVVSPSVFVSVV